MWEILQEMWEILQEMWEILQEMWELSSGSGLIQLQIVRIRIFMLQLGEVSSYCRPMYF